MCVCIAVLRKFLFHEKNIIVVRMEEAHWSKSQMHMPEAFAVANDDCGAQQSVTGMLQDFGKWLVNVISPTDPNL